MADANEKTINESNTRVTLIRHPHLSYKNIAELRDTKTVDFQVEISQSHAVRSSTKDFVMNTIIKYLTVEGEAFLEYENQMIFNLTHFDLVVTENENGAFVDTDFISNISYICLTTIRGILAEKLSNTPLSRFYLPLVDSSFIDIMRLPEQK